MAAMWSKRGGSRFLWWTSTAVSVGLLATLISIWYLVGTAMRDMPDIGSPVLDQADVETFLADHPEPDVGGEQLRIPTGVFIQSLEFLSTNNVQVTGYVWQVYAASVPSDIQRGFVLPEAVDEAYQTQEVYRHAEAGGRDHQLVLSRHPSPGVRLPTLPIRSAGRVVATPTSGLRPGRALGPGLRILHRPDANHAAGAGNEARVRGLGSGVRGV